MFLSSDSFDPVVVACVVFVFVVLLFCDSSSISGLGEVRRTEPVIPVIAVIPAGSDQIRSNPIKYGNGSSREISSEAGKPPKSEKTQMRGAPGFPGAPQARVGSSIPSQAHVPPRNRLVATPPGYRGNITSP